VAPCHYLLTALPPRQADALVTRFRGEARFDTARAAVERYLARGWLGSMTWFRPWVYGFADAASAGGSDDASLSPQARYRRTLIEELNLALLVAQGERGQRSAVLSGWRAHVLNLATIACMIAFLMLMMLAIALERYFLMFC